MKFDNEVFMPMLELARVVADDNQCEALERAKSPDPDQKILDAMKVVADFVQGPTMIHNFEVPNEELQGGFLA